MQPAASMNMSGINVIQEYPGSTFTVAQLIQSKKLPSLACLAAKRLVETVVTEYKVLVKQQPLPQESQKRLLQIASECTALALVPQLDRWDRLTLQSLAEEAPKYVKYYNDNIYKN